MALNPVRKRALGTCYYPEHWPEEMWAGDAALMVKTGLKLVRIGEFAWSRIEPKPGDFDWGWMDRAIETLGTAGLKVVLSTPTATPPRWMLDQLPDMLAVDVNGNQRKFGSRRHYCFSHIGYREQCARIAQKLGERYGNNSHVQAWQIDNEYGCHDTTLSYSQAAVSGFRDWLAQKYQSPEALNKAWGNVFWSMEYSEFDQIDLPNQTVTEPNPAHVLDFMRFSSDQVVRFNRVQTEVLRQFTDKPLIHNYMGRITDFDHYQVGADLDIASWDSYPLGFLEGRSDDGDDWKHKFMRQGDPDFQAFHHDLYRRVGNDRWWVMEQQPGPVNWAPNNPAPLPGMARLWALEAFAHGAEAVCYFRWRQVPFGQEQMHAGMLRPDSVPAPALAEAAQVAKELASFPDVETGPSKIALIFDYESAWGWKIQPQGKDFDYFRLVFDFYRALRKLGLSIDIISPNDADLQSYKLVLMPGLMNLGADLREAMPLFKGTVLAGPRTGSKTETMQIPPQLAPDIPGLDCRAEYVESLRTGTDVPLAQGGAFVHWHESLETTSTALELTRDGRPAIVMGANIIYLAGWPDQVALERILNDVCLDIGIPTLDLPGNLRVRDSGPVRFVFNYGTEQASFGGQNIPSAGVIWQSLRNLH